MTLSIDVFKLIVSVIVVFLFMWCIIDYLWYRHKQAVRIENKEIDQIRNQRGW